jgi:hypothetical protein
MRKILISGLCFIFSIQSVNVYARGNSDNGAEAFARKGWEEEDYLRTLSPELQVHVLITRYKHSGGTPFTFYRSASDVLAKNPEAVKPVLFEWTCLRTRLVLKQVLQNAWHFAVFKRKLFKN